MGTCRIFQFKEAGVGGNSSRWHRVDEGRQMIPTCFGNEFWRDEFQGEYELVTGREQCDGGRLWRSCWGGLKITSTPHAHLRRPVLSIGWGWGCYSLNLRSLLPLPPFRMVRKGAVEGRQEKLLAIPENGSEFLCVITCHLYVGDKLGGWDLKAIFIHFSAFG